MFDFVQLTQLCTNFVLVKGWGTNTMCGNTGNDKLEEVAMKIITDKECRKAHGPFQKWNKGNYTGVGVGPGNVEDNWIKVGNHFEVNPIFHRGGGLF